MVTLQLVVDVSGDKEGFHAMPIGFKIKTVY
jgi:hypothetical protein